MSNVQTIASKNTQIHPFYNFWNFVQRENKPLMLVGCCFFFFLFVYEYITLFSVLSMAEQLSRSPITYFYSFFKNLEIHLDPNIERFFEISRAEQLPRSHIDSPYSFFKNLEIPLDPNIEVFFKITVNNNHYDLARIGLFLLRFGLIIVFIPASTYSILKLTYTLVTYGDIIMSQPMPNFIPTISLSTLFIAVPVVAVNYIFVKHFTTIIVWLFN